MTEGVFDFMTGKRIETSINPENMTPLDIADAILATLDISPFDQATK